MDGCGDYDIFPSSFLGLDLSFIEPIHLGLSSFYVMVIVFGPTDLIFLFTIFTDQYPSMSESVPVLSIFFLA